MIIPTRFYQFLRERISLSTVVSSKIKLQKRGAEYLGICPFHNEKTPSFTINDIKKFYYCFGCSAHGDVIKFTSEVSGLSYKEAAIKLANDYGFEIPKSTKKEQEIYEEGQEILNILDLATQFFNQKLKENEHIISYLSKRNIDSLLITQFEIGYAPKNNAIQQFFASRNIPLMHLTKAGLIVKKDDNIYDFFRDRIIFPIKDIYNRTIGFGGRIVNDGMPKYLNSSENVVFKKNHVLYAQNIALPNIHKSNYAILVEGYIDAITLHKAGFKEAVATLGTAVTVFHIEKLWNITEEIIVCLDGDLAGQKAINRIIGLVLPLINSKKRISFIRLPQSYDPDEVIKNNGASFFNDLLNNRISLSQLIWDIEYDSTKCNTPEGISLLEANLNSYTNIIQDKILYNNYKRFFKNQIWNYCIKSNNTSKLEQKHKSIKEITTLQKNNIYTKQEHLEYALCSILLKYPNIIFNEELKDLLLNVKFTILLLQRFLEWFFDYFAEINTLNESIVRDAMINNGFIDTFNLLNGYFNNILSFSNIKNCNNTNYELLFRILYKKYQLLLLELEYTQNLNNNIADNEFNKAKLYQLEIINVNIELEKLINQLVDL